MNEPTKVKIIMPDSTTSVNISVDGFTRAIFGELPEGETVCYSRMRADGKFRGRNQPYRDVERDYFCVSAVKHSGELFQRRRRSDARAAYCLVLDDVGTKVDEPKVEPSWKLETSPDNWQWGYIIERCEDLDFYEACLDGLADAGLTDPGAKGCTRVMRVPGSLHNEEDGYRAELTLWAPARRWGLPALMDALGVEPGKVGRRHEPMALPEGLQIADPVLGWLLEQGRLLGGERDGWFDVVCPWEEEHNSENGPTDTGYSPLGAGDHPDTRGFRCFHSHGDKYRARDFLDWVEAQGGPASQVSETDMLFLAARDRLTEIVADLAGGPAGGEKAAAVDVAAIERMVGQGDELDAALSQIDEGSREAARGVVQGLERRIEGTLKIQPLTDMMARAALEQASGKVLVLQRSGMLTKHAVAAFTRHILKGCFKMLGKDATKEDRDAVRDTILGFIEKHRQITSLHVLVDMFTTQPSLAIAGGEARVVLPFTPLAVETGDANPEAVADFRDHFPEFDAMLDAVLASRFAADRRRAFLFMNHGAGWGKGILTDAMKNLGLVLRVSAREIEKALDGGPIGIDLSAATKSWILHIDEWKHVKSELKMLNNEITGAAKNQMRTTAPLFFKLFTAKESVEALMGEAGVEEQFAERFSYLPPDGKKLDHRAVFLRLGNGVYRRALEAHIAETLNAGVQRHQALGRIAAERQGGDALAAFHALFGIEKHSGSLSQTVRDVAEIVREVLTEPEQLEGRVYGHNPKFTLAFSEPDQPGIVFKHLAAFVRIVIKHTFSASESTKVAYRTNDIVNQLADIPRDSQKRFYAYPAEWGEGDKAHEVQAGPEKVRMRGTFLAVDKNVLKALIASHTVIKTGKRVH